MSDLIERQDIVKERFDWEVPVESVPIPSQGKVYSSDSPLHNLKTGSNKINDSEEKRIF